jgi:ABC-type nitrate/sulfonate/bicarbonate transport system permease component
MTTQLPAEDLAPITEAPERSSPWNRIANSTWARALVSLVVVIICWEIVSGWLVSEYFFPGPRAVFRTGVELTASGELFENIRASLFRILAGFAIGCLIGAPLGLVMASSKLFNDLVSPYMQLLRFIPAIAWLTPAVIWLGVGEASKIALIAYTTLFIVAINTMVGVSNIPTERLWAANSMGARPGQVFRFVVIPSTVPFVLTGMRLAMGNSFATVVPAEMIAADKGLGAMIFNARLFGATDKIFVGIIVLGIMGLLTDLLFRWLSRRYLGHYGPSE